MYNGVRIKEFGYMRIDGSVHPNPELFAAKKEYFDKGWGEECEKFKKYIEEFKCFTLDGKPYDDGTNTLEFIRRTRNSAKEVIESAKETKNGNWEKRVEFYKIWLDLLEKRIRKIKREIKTGKRK